jgi:hypothetical protein
VPESLRQRRVEVVARLKSLEAAVKPITEFLSEEGNVKLLKQDKAQNMAFLQKEFGIGEFVQCCAVLCDLCTHVRPKHAVAACWRKLYCTPPSKRSRAHNLHAVKAMGPELPAAVEELAPASQHFYAFFLCCQPSRRPGPD